MKNLSVRYKIILLIIALTTIILSGVLYTIANSLNSDIERQVFRDFRKRQHFFRKQATLVYDRLVESCLLIGENAAFKASVELQDQNTIMQSVIGFAGYAKADLMIVTNRFGEVLAWLGDESQAGALIGNQPGLQFALAGEYPEDDLDWPILWVIEEDLFQVVSVPIFAGESILGTITMGMQFTGYEANELKGESNLEISLFWRNVFWAAVCRRKRSREGTVCSRS